MSKTLKEPYYFVLYDLKDNIDTYFNFYYELKKYIKLPIKKINYLFKCNKRVGLNYIIIKIDHKNWKLYRYLKIDGDLYI